MYRNSTELFGWKRECVWQLTADTFPSPNSQLLTLLYLSCTIHPQNTLVWNMNIEEFSEHGKGVFFTTFSSTFVFHIRKTNLQKSKWV
jgi:hypothetical protein